MDTSLSSLADLGVIVHGPDTTAFTPPEGEAGESDQAFAGRHMCDSAEWYSPEWIAQLARQVMGGIDLDPASNEEANQIIRATRIYTKEDDGLTKRWYGRMFVNPPGSKTNSLVGPFWSRLVREYLDGEVAQALWVGYSLEQLQTLQQTDAARQPGDFPLCIPSARIPFVENALMQERRAEKIRLAALKPDASKTAQVKARQLANGRLPKSQPSHANYLAYLGPRVQEFLDIFSTKGWVSR